MNMSKWLGLREMFNLNFWRAVLAEVIASGFFVFISCGQLVPVDEDMQASRLQGALTVGLTVTCLASSFWEISGGHFNPAVSFAMLVSGKIKLARFVMYIIAQCTGSVGGAAILYAVTPSEYRSNGYLGSLVIHEELEPGVAAAIELILTFQFVMVIFSSTDPVRGMTGFQAPLAIGLSIVIGLLMEGPYTGGALNPIRAFGPAVVTQRLKNQWVYWVGPILGGVLAALTYKYVLKLKETPGEDDIDITVGEFVKPARSSVVKNKNSRL